MLEVALVRLLMHETNNLQMNHRRMNNALEALLNPMNRWPFRKAFAAAYVGMHLLVQIICALRILRRSEHIVYLTWKIITGLTLPSERRQNASLARTETRVYIIHASTKQKNWKTLGGTTGRLIWRARRYVIWKFGRRDAALQIRPTVERSVCASCYPTPSGI